MAISGAGTIALKASKMLRPSMKRDDTYTRLRELILNEYSPGQALSEQELANLIGVSRTPIREALFRLEKDGLITIVPRRGPFVAALTVRDIHELFEVREALELYAAKRAAEQVDLRELDRIQKEADKIYSHLGPALTSEEKYKALSGVFDELHRMILMSRDNTRFIALLETIRGTWHFARKMLTRRITEEDVARTYEEHTRIIEALRGRDPLGAETAMQVHLENSRKRFLAAVRP
jgi:DNA-binding GntR family transcriptional regulator